MPKTSEVKAVLFDLGDTLVSTHAVETMKKILQALDIVISIDSVEHAMMESIKEFEAEKHSNLSAHEFYKELNLLHLKHLGITNQAVAEILAEEIDARWFEFANVHAYPEVKETLQHLRKRGLRLGLITGGYEVDIEQILSRANLEGYFDVCVGADTTGNRKPCPEVFRYALKKLNVRADEAVFVGDSLERDYQAAKKVGMIAVMINREGKPVANDVKSISNLKQIVDFL